MNFQRKWIDYLNQYDDLSLLVEARVKDVKRQYPQYTEMGWLDWFRQNIESNLGPRGVSKFILWTMREFANNYPPPEDDEDDWDLAPAGEDPDNTAVAGQILDAVLNFERYAQRHRLKGSDIYQLSTIGVERLIAKIEKIDTQKQARAKKKEKAMKGSEIIYDDHGVFAVRPKTEGASCYYGRNTKWCISATESKNYYDQYTEEGLGFVMVRIDSLPTDHKFHKIAVVFSRRHSEDWEAEEIFDVFDESYEIDILYMALGRGDGSGGGGAGLSSRMAADVYDDIIVNGKASMENSPPESGMEQKAEEIMKRHAQHHSQNFQAYYDVDNDGTRDFLNFGASYYFTIEPEDIGKYEIPTSWGTGAQDFMDAIVQALDQDISFYIEEVDSSDSGNEGIQLELRKSTEGYEPNPNGFDSFLENEGVDLETSRDIQKVLKHYLRKEEYLKPTPISKLQGQTEAKEETWLSTLENFDVHHNDHEGIFFTLEKRFILFNGKEIGLDKIPKGYKNDVIPIDISDGLDDNLDLNYLRAVLGKKTRQAISYIKKETEAIADIAAQQMDLPIKDLPPRAVKKFPQKHMISSKYLGVQSVTIQGTSLGDHAVAYTIGFALRHGPFGNYKSIDNEELYIDEVADLAEYIDENLDVVAKGLKNFVVNEINNMESAYKLATSESIDNEINEYFELLTEEKDRPRQRGIYKFYCMIGYTIEIGESKRGLDDILAEMRALPTVTIVNVAIANRKIAEQTYIAGLSIKFIPSYPGTFSNPEDAKSKILRACKRLKNVQRIFKVSTSIERIE